MLDFMSLSNADKYLDEAKEQLLPHDIFDSLLNAVDELNREVKRMVRDVHHIRRQIIQNNRRPF